MSTRVLPDARDDLREAVRYYRNIKPPVLGKQLATRMMAAFKEAVVRAASMSLGRPEHLDIPGARYVMFEGFPYMLFYTVRADSFCLRGPGPGSSIGRAGAMQTCTFLFNTVSAARAPYST